jgi:hypothetical protein
MGHDSIEQLLLGKVTKPTTAISELSGWFARLEHPRCRQPLAASDRKVLVVTAQSRGLKGRLIRNGRVVAFHVFS